jgi:hypothetical protein
MTGKRVLMTFFMLVLFTACCTIALAVDSTSGSTTIIVRSATFVAGTEIQPGEYKVRWEANNPEATVTFTTDGKSKITVKGKLVESNKKFEQTTSLTAKDSTDREIIKEIRVSGKKYSIVFE